MNNEIQRKITSLTLMTIMLAGGMVIAAPGMEPAFAATSNLFVSAENSQFNNYMSGPQVIEVVVIDSDISDTDEGKGEPDVTINGKIMRMVQAVDGNWYGYFADKTQASIADSTNSGVVGEGLDFGTLCTASTGTTYLGIDVGDTVGVAIPAKGSSVSGADGTSTGAVDGTCNAVVSPTNTGIINVVREAKDLNTTLDKDTTIDLIGQIGIGIGGTLHPSLDGFWPFIQLYDLTEGGNVNIQYNKGGGAQSVTLTFDDADDFAGLSLDKTVYTRDAQVHATITDTWLNIDPTDEDSWTFGTEKNNLSTNYQVFNENGAKAGAANSNGIIDISSSLSKLMGDDVILILDADAQNSNTNVLTIQNNDDSVILCSTSSIADCKVDSASTKLDVGTQPVTITELGPNSGVFGTFDESDVSAIIMTSGALRGTSATIDYNDSPVTILTGFSTATIDIQPIDSEWSSGEEIPVILVDGDANKNSRTDEDLELNNPDVALIPSLSTGNPFTLGSSGSNLDAIFLNLDASTATIKPTSSATLGSVVSNWEGNAFNDGSDGTVTIIASGVTTISATPVIAGTGYEASDTVTLTGQTSGTSNATGTVTSILGEITTVTVGGTLTSYTQNELVTLATTSGSGIGATGTATISSGGVLSAITITAGGTGFVIGNTLSITGDSSTTSTGVATVATLTGKITVISTTPATAGSGYTNGETVTLTGEGNADATATITVDGAIISVSLADGGTDYSITTALALTGGSGSSGTVNVSSVDSEGIITGIVAGTAKGTGYTNGDILTVNGKFAGDVVSKITVQSFSQRSIITPSVSTTYDALFIDLDTTVAKLQDSIYDSTSDADKRLFGFNLLNIDLRSIDSSGKFDVYLVSGTIADNLNKINSTNTSALLIANNVDSQSLSLMDTNESDIAVDAVSDVIFGLADIDSIGLLIVGDSANTLTISTSTNEAIVADFFSFGFTNDGLEASERIANQIIRIEAEETGDNTGTFEGTLEYTMVNQINILDASTYTGLSTISDEAQFIVIEDLTDEDAPRVNYLDLGSDGVSTQIADQEEAPSHSGVVSFDSTNYKTADTVVITLEDLDLNTDSDLLEIYTVVTAIADKNQGAIGSGNSTSGGTSITLGNGQELGRLLDITFDDERWQTPTNACLATLSGAAGTDTGLGATGFTLVETGPATGVFTGDFQIPNQWCRSSSSTAETATGLDIEVNYVDFRDASGEVIEVGDSAGVRANTGSVSLDRTVYPVPFGVPSEQLGDTAANGATSPTGRAVFPIHASGMDSTDGLGSGEFITGGDLTIHVRVNDPDFDVSASGEDTIATNSTSGVGPVKISVIRGSSSVILGYAGGDSILEGTIDTDKANTKSTRAFGPMTEIAPDAGIFESDITIRYTDGPASTKCSSTTSEWTNILDGTGTEITDRFDKAPTTSGEYYCILQGDILQVEYTDPADASGDINTVTDSATFDLRNGVLQSDKSVYIIGSDMILTLIEPDFDLDNDQAETYDLDLIEWDSDAATLSMGDKGGSASSNGKTFDPEPLNFRETGDSTGIFQIVIEIPEALGGDNLERGEEIVLEYTDWGPSGSDYVGEEDEDVNVTVFTSNFGATVELDQKVYTWTDKVYITIVAPDHNFDGDLIDEIGNTNADPIKVSTRGHNIDQYKLVETGTDTGIFTGEVILTGFKHDADGDTTTGDADGNDVLFVTASGSGPTDGLLPADDDDGLTVSFEFSEDETVVGSALIRWNIGETQWLEASYPASGTGVVRVIDPDMNLDPEAVDNFDIDVWSDSDAGGIDLTVTETNEATGIFEGTVFFTVSDESSGHRLRVAEGDTVTAEYEDNTLPDPYTTADELDITATSLIGTVVPPLERAPAANLRVVDAFGNSLDTVSVDQQVQISADLANGQDREQTFAYLVQIQDGDGVTVSLAWITGTLSSGQSFSPALSWIPTSSGSFTATAFVWESVDNPTALSPPVSTTITVS